MPGVGKTTVRVLLANLLPVTLGNLLGGLLLSGGLWAGFRQRP